MILKQQTHETRKVEDEANSQLQSNGQNYVPPRPPAMPKIEQTADKLKHCMLSFFFMHEPPCFLKPKS
jgi:hypothetical protein